MDQKPAVGISNGQFITERQRIIEELVLRMDSLTSLAIITIDSGGNDHIEVLGNLHSLQQLTALTTQQISAELSITLNAH